MELLEAVAAQREPEVRGNLELPVQRRAVPRPKVARKAAGGRKKPAGTAVARRKAKAGRPRK
jgi:hypothetical protein